MTLMTADEYVASLRSVRKRVFVLGEEVGDYVDHPLIRPSLNACAETYAVAQEPAYEALATARSSVTGERVNRFTHLHQDPGDLVAKVKLLRLLGQRTGCCFQRCVGMDALNAVDSVTFELDRDLGTGYHARFREYLRHVQARDLVVDGAMTDPKGNRRLAPGEQADPDLFLRMTERRADGMVVRGAKVHQTGAVNAHEILIMPTQSLAEADAAYAVACAVPADAPGLLCVVGRQPSDSRKLEGVDAGNARFGGHEAVIILDDVFVPWERVFLCGEVRHAGLLVERFAGYHRQSYGGCKVGVGDVLIGAAQALAEYQGTEKASHIRDKIIEMVHLNETLFACGIACSAQGTATASGTYLVDLLLANVCKLNVTRFPYEIARLAQDIAGGLLVTLPSERDFQHPAVGGYLEKYLRGVARYSTEQRCRMLRLVENLTIGPGAVGYLTESLHGAGSPQAQRIMLGRLADIGSKVRLAERLAGYGETSGSL
ncbi:MAG TPA: 4-hydroxyphenylacetate 3-hydroxylase N-terminal domain-containing protein [Anaerolineae bacterium]|nr:4-hydroxyphenylacetate 3-hydroxylase N-terminal domain-containing protein [Anaerolineae bacterium]HPL29075.1 4-hydroxyphenylacetate 3-hydroxylase N-terminal domain-containing protein [Anaerolineae bacterium]